jgi:aspartate racemase
MKTIGLIGGMSWESSSHYYRLINEMVRDRLGGYHSAPSVMVSVDFAEIEGYQRAGNWEDASKRLVETAQKLERADVDFIVLCTNTLHKIADDIIGAIDVPFLHIADATAHAIQSADLKTVGLLGTRFTMREDFYKGRLTEKYGLNVLVPDEDGQKMVDDVIFTELVQGIVKEPSRQAYITEIKKLAERGAEGVILGCTEIGMLIEPQHSPIQTFDTTIIHAQAAVDFALESV